MKSAAFWILVVVLGLLAVLVTGEMFLRATGFERRDGSQRDLHELRFDRRLARRAGAAARRADRARQRS